MKISAAEKLILTMLSDIGEKIGLSDSHGIDPKFIKAAIFSENLWAIGWNYCDYKEESEDPPEVKDVVNYLDMWSFIEEAYEKMDPAEREELKTKASPFGDNPTFPGFDGNNEHRHSSVASFMVDYLDRFSRFKGRIINSHMPTIDGYNRMHKVFEPIRPTLHSRRLSVSEVATILNARRHSRPA